MKSDSSDSSDRSDNSDRPNGDGQGASGERDSELASRRAASEADEWWVDRYVLFSARESTLWVLLLVVMVHIAGFVASALLATLRTGHPLGVTISLLLVAGTAASVRAEVRRKGKPAGLTWLLLAVWLLSGAVAWGGDRLGLL